jgi:ParB family chromosome partitioning protein
VDESLVNARLSALFPGASQPAATERKDQEPGSFRMLAHESIQVRPQVRRTFPQPELDELAASIREIRAQGGGIEGTGVLQALLVTPEGDSYRLIAGEKRFRATKAAEVPEVPCVVVPPAPEGMVRLLQLTENALRTPPPILEEAAAIQEAMREQKLSIRNMARALGKEKGYVEGRLSLLKFPPDVQEMVSARADTLRHARHIGAVEDQNLRAALIQAVAEDGISEREVQRRIAAKSSTPSAADDSVSARADTEPSEHAARTEGHAKPQDFIGGSLRPMASLLAKFNRQLAQVPLTGEVKQAIAAELGLLEQEIASLKQRLEE